jgi:hypothetical protein
MGVLIVSESMFGNTRKIADAVGDALSGYTTVDVIDVAEAPSTIGPDVELLVVGAPTHAFGMSRPGTRRSAVEQGAGGSPDVGVREWLATVSAPAGGVPAASFDTRIGRPRFPGSAARAAARLLRRVGFAVIAPPQSFWVEATPGLPRAGEVDRAHRWGHELGATIRARRNANVRDP